MSTLTFRSSLFNITERRPYFINDDCFGDDVAKWLRERLEQRDFATREPGQEDWGWYLEVKFEGQWYFLAIGLQRDEHGGVGDLWMISVEPNFSFRDLFRGKSKDSIPAFLNELEAILRADAGIGQVQREPD